MAREIDWENDALDVTKVAEGTAGIDWETDAIDMTKVAADTAGIDWETDAIDMTDSVDWESAPDVTEVLQPAFGDDLTFLQKRGLDVAGGTGDMVGSLASLAAGSIDLVASGAQEHPMRWQGSAWPGVYSQPMPLRKKDTEKLAQEISRISDEWQHKTTYEGMDLMSHLTRGAASMIPFMGAGALAARLGKSAAFVAGMIEAAVEAGGVQQELVSMGMDPSEAMRKSGAAFLANLPVTTLTNVGLFRFLKGSQEYKILSQFAGNPAAMAGHIAKGMVSQAGKESFQEAYQQAVQNVAVGAPWDRGLGTSAAVGGILGGFMGGVGGIPAAMSDPQPVVRYGVGGEQIFDPEPDNVMSAGMRRYLEDPESDFSVVIRAVPTKSAALGLPIAGPAGGPTAKFKIELVKVDDLKSGWDFMWSGLRNSLQAAGGGKHNSRHVLEIQYPLEHLQLAQYRYLDKILADYQKTVKEIGLKGAEHRLVGHVTEWIASDEVNIPPERLLQMKEKALSDVADTPSGPQVKVAGVKPLGWAHKRHIYFQDLDKSRQLKVISQAQALRKWYDARLESEVNPMRERQGRKRVGKRGNYFSRMQKSGALGILKSPDSIKDRPGGVPDYLHATEVESQFTKHRRWDTAPYEQEWDHRTVVERYANSVSRDMFDTAAIQYTKPFIEMMRKYGKVNSATSLERTMDYLFGNRRTPIDKASDSVFGHQGLEQLRSVARYASRSLAAASLGLNFKWNIFTQTSSGALIWVRTPTKHVVQALQDYRDPQMRAKAKATYNIVTKGRTGGQVTSQDFEQMEGGVVSLHDNPAKRLGRFMLQGFTSRLETDLSVVAALAGYRHGKARGMSESEAWQFGGDLAAKTQSMYNRRDKPLILGARDTGLIERFQTFAFEMLNTARESGTPLISNIFGRTGYYADLHGSEAAGMRRLANRAMFAGKFLAMVMMQNWVHEKLFQKPLWKVSSFFPFGKMLLHDYYLPSPDHPLGRYHKPDWQDMKSIGPVGFRYYIDLMGALVDVFDGGKKHPADGLMRWALRYHIPGGAQLGRIARTLEANRTGKLWVEGKDIDVYPDSALETLEAMLLGPTYGFDEARERRRELEERRKERQEEQE